VPATTNEGDQLPIYDGVVTVNDDQVPVIIGLEEDGIRMSTNGMEIGEWAVGDYTIDHAGDGVYTITADNESLVFVPNRPDLFAAGVGHPGDYGGPMIVEDESGRHVAESRPVVEAVTHGTEDGESAPRPLTRALFYTLAGTTAALGLWALVRLIF
jgi:hypothetical protein